MSITSANSVLIIGVNSLFGTPQQLQGFGNDDAYAIDSVNVSESLLGVDGIKSTGWIPQLKIMHITLMADSQSINFFEAWYAAQESAREVLTGFGTLVQGSIGRVYTLTNGTLEGYTPIAEAKKILGARRFTINWQVALGAPI